jgi:hypothetical protein
VTAAKIRAADPALSETWTDTEAPSAAAARVETVDPATWDASLEIFEDVHYEHTSIFIARQWGRKNILCVHVRDNGELIGAACYGLARQPIKGGVGFCKFGPAWRVRGKTATAEGYRRVVETLCRHAVSLGLALTIIPRPHPRYTDMECDQLAALGFDARPRLNGDHYIVDAGLSADDQMASFTAKCRSNMRKANETDIAIAELTDYGVFENLYAQMSERKGVMLFSPVDVVPALANALAAPLRPRGFVASSNGKPIAARIYGVLGDTAYSLYSATTEEALPLRAGYRLHWEILNAIRGKAQWYDLGIGSGDQGMQWFKEGLIGKRGKLVIVPSEFDYAEGLKARLALRTLQAMRGARRLYMKIRQTLIR